MLQYSKVDTARLVKEGRIAKGYTQQELSDLTRISLRSVQRIENGEVLPRLYTLKILADQLGFSLDDVVETEVPVKKATLNKPRKIILSIGSLLLIILLTGAYVSQSAHFPETNFERFLLYAGVLTVYGLALLRIWK